MSSSLQCTASLVEGSGKDNPYLGGGRSPSVESGKVISVTATLGQGPNRFLLSFGKCHPMLCGNGWLCVRALLSCFILLQIYLAEITFSQQVHRDLVHRHQDHREWQLWRGLPSQADRDREENDCFPWLHCWLMSTGYH